MTYKKSRYLIIIMMALITTAIVKMIIEEHWYDVAATITGLVIFWYGDNFNIKEYRKNIMTPEITRTVEIIKRYQHILDRENSAVKKTKALLDEAIARLEELKKGDKVAS